MNIAVKTIEHKDQEYPTVGDWRQDRMGDWFIRVSKLGNWKMEFLVSLHEQIEMALCQARGISEGEVTAFDLGFEAARSTGDDREPGAQLSAPYHREHVFAERIERQVAQELGVDWDEYEAVIANL